MPEPSRTPGATQSPATTTSLRVMLAIALLGALTAGLTAGLGSALLRNAVLVALPAIGAGILVDRMLLHPLRRLAAGAAAVDPVQPPAPGAPEHHAHSFTELRQVSQSLSSLHQRLWQQLLDERQRTAELAREVEQRQRALREALQVLAEKTRAMSDIGRVDALTGLANRREFDIALRREFKRAQRQRGLLSLAVLDLDHLRAYNKRHDGSAGDTALARFAQLLSVRFKRDTDLVARLDGPRFAALLPGFHVGAAQDLLEQVRSDLLAPQLPHDGTGQRALTASIGLACYGPHHPYLSSQTLMEAAEEALYFAKHAGRDRISLAASGGPYG